MIKIDNSELNLRYSLRADYIRKMNPSVEKTTSLKSFIIDIEKDILGIAGDGRDCFFATSKNEMPWKKEQRIIRIQYYLQWTTYSTVKLKIV